MNERKNGASTEKNVLNLNSSQFITTWNLSMKISNNLTDIVCTSARMLLFTKSNFLKIHPQNSFYSRLSAKWDVDDVDGV